MKTIAKPRYNKKFSSAKKHKRLLMIGLGGGVVAGLGYLAYTYFRNKAQMNSSFPVSEPTNNSNGFPISRGARGPLVTRIQKALLAKGGQAALIIKETSFKNGLVDGVFGRGTQRALRAAGFPSALTATQFNTLVNGTAVASGFNASGIAQEIKAAAHTKNLFGVLNGLKRIQTVAQYKKVSAFFQNIRITGTRVSSLVNALLSVAFANKPLEKVKIRAQFKRMGLKQNARGIWYIPNLGTIGNAFNSNAEQWDLAIAAQPTLLRSDDGAIILPELLPNTVVGYITAIENGTARILTQSGETVFAPSRHLNTL